MLGSGKSIKQLFPFLFMTTQIDFSGVKPVMDTRQIQDEILEKYNPIEILRWYYGKDFSLGIKYSSPFRKDNDPSFGFFYSDRYKTILGHDFKTAKFYNCFTFVRELYNISYVQAVRKIAIDFGVIEAVNEKPIDRRDFELLEDFQNKLVKTEYKYTVITRAQGFSQKELDWWMKYNVSEALLRRFHVLPLLRVYINRSFWKLNGMIFGYYFPKTKNIKIYSPEEQSEKKWRGSVQALTDIYGYDQLPEEGDLLIITKSLKDVMSLYSFGYTAIAFQTEAFNSSATFIDRLKDRFKRVVTLFDNDAAGERASQYYLDMYGLEPIAVPLWYGTKDISDTIEAYGTDISIKLLKTLLMENTQETREIVMALHSYFNELLDHMGLAPDNIANVQRRDDVIYIQTKDGKCEAITKMTCNETS